MNPRLSIQKTKTFQTSHYAKQKNKIVFKFCVVDSDKGEYPANYLCILPTKIDKDSGFTQVFPENTREKAIELLERSKVDYFQDSQILKEILHRIYVFKKSTLPKRHVCPNCGVEIEGGFCSEACKSSYLGTKHYTSQVPRLKKPHIKKVWVPRTVREIYREYQ
jgi:hypothetical protein